MKMCNSRKKNIFKINFDQVVFFNWFHIDAVLRNKRVAFSQTFEYFSTQCVPKRFIEN